MRTIGYGLDLTVVACHEPLVSDILVAHSPVIIFLIHISEPTRDGGSELDKEPCKGSLAKSSTWHLMSVNSIHLPWTSYCVLQRWPHMGTPHSLDGPDLWHGIPICICCWRTQVLLFNYHVFAKFVQCGYCTQAADLKKVSSKRYETLVNNINLF